MRYIILAQERRFNPAIDLYFSVANDIPALLDINRGVDFVPVWRDIHILTFFTQLSTLNGGQIFIFLTPVLNAFSR